MAIAARPAAGSRRVSTIPTGSCCGSPNRLGRIAMRLGMLRYDLAEVAPRRGRRDLLGHPRQGDRRARLCAAAVAPGCDRRLRTWLSHAGRTGPPAEPYYTPTMARELPMFSPPGGTGHGHGPAELPSIAMGGGLMADPAADGSTALRRHPDWIRARMPSGENYHDLKGLLRGLDRSTRSARRPTARTSGSAGTSAPRRS